MQDYKATKNELHMFIHPLFFRLLDVIYSEKKLYLVFEYLSQDLKKYMDTAPTGGLSTRLVKVIIFFEPFSYIVHLDNKNVILLGSK